MPVFKIDCDHYSAADRDLEFFYRHPERRHRMRFADAAEIEEFRTLGCVIPEPYRPCVVVQRASHDEYLRLLIGMPKDLAIHPSEKHAQVMFEFALARAE
jgi:hypothetical protein